MILQMSELLSGTYDEDESAASFQEALQAWRNSDASKPAQHAAACLYIITSLLYFQYFGGRYIKAFCLESWH